MRRSHLGMYALDRGRNCFVRRMARPSTAIIQLARAARACSWRVACATARARPCPSARQRGSTRAPAADRPQRGATRHAVIADEAERPLPSTKAAAATDCLYLEPCPKCLCRSASRQLLSQRRRRRIR
eukprot:6203548-Pleurochrysis_carterae.AAC.3